MQLLGTVVLKYSPVKYLQIYGVSLCTIIVYGSCRGAKFAGLVGFVWRSHRIEWRAASEHLTSTRRYRRLSLEKGLFAPANKQQRRSVCCCNEYRHWNGWQCTAHDLVSVCSTCLLAARTMPVTNYRHFSYAWRHRLAWAEYVSIYNDVQIFAAEIFVDGCWSTKTVNIKPCKNLSAYGFWRLYACCAIRMSTSWSKSCCQWFKHCIKMDTGLSKTMILNIC